MVHCSYGLIRESSRCVILQEPIIDTSDLYGTVQFVMCCIWHYYTYNNTFFNELNHKGLFAMNNSHLDG